MLYTYIHVLFVELRLFETLLDRDSRLISCDSHEVQIRTNSSRSKLTALGPGGSPGVS